ncbi:MAG: hypothetical protein AAFQ27_10545 [Pseudomonadota bacterium]
MQDAPSAELPAEPLAVEVTAGSPEQASESLPAVTERADGTIVVDLTRLAPRPEAQECIASDPNPLDNAIIVCGEGATDQRVYSSYGPADEPGEFGSAIPRARVKLSDNVEAEANVIKKGVGGWDANGAEVKVKIDF